MKKNIKGEIATILTVSSLVILGIFSLASSLFLKQKQTTRTKAGVTCQIPGGGIGQDCSDIYKCDIKGGCNPACCFLDKHCPSGQTCDVPNGYCISGKSCNPNTGSTNQPTPPLQNNQSPPPPATNNQTGACFSIRADFEVRDEGDKKAFYATVIFESAKGGDIKLDYNGIHVAGWNRFGGGSFTYSPQWTQPHTNAHEAGIAALTPKQKIDFTYRGMHSGCSPQDVTISCSVGVKGNGETYVSGNGCSCRNCGGGVSLPTNTPIPTSHPQPQYLTPTPTPQPGKLGGKCIFNVATNNYYCNDGICSNQKICVTPIQTPTLIIISSSTPTPTHGPTNTSIPTSTSTPIPSPTPDSSCNLEDTKYCVEYGLTEMYRNNNNISDDELKRKHNTKGEIKKCDISSGANAGKYVLISTQSYNEDCYYRSDNLEIKGLIGRRKIDLRNGGSSQKYGCIYTINNVKCNPNGGWDKRCKEYCDLNPTYPVTLKFNFNLKENSSIMLKIFLDNTIIFFNDELNNISSYNLESKIEVNKDKLIKCFNDNSGDCMLRVEVGMIFKNLNYIETTLKPVLNKDDLSTQININ